MKIKIFNKIIAVCLILMTSNMMCFASTWVTISSENSKKADLDLDSIKLAVDTVEYDIKMQQDNITNLYRFSTALYKEGTPTAIISGIKYKDGKEVSRETIKERKYKNIKEGTLSSEIYDVLSKMISAKDLNKGEKELNQYLKEQRKIILKNWQREKFSLYNSQYVNYSKHITPVYSNKILLQIDRKGNVVYSYSDDEFKKVSNIKLDALPSEYTGEIYNLNIDMNYYKYAGCKIHEEKPYISIQSPSEATIKISKNSKIPVLGHIQYGLLSTIVGLEKTYKPSFPLYLFPITLAVIPIDIIICMFYGCLGGDFKDIPRT